MAHITGKYNLANFGIYPYCKAEFHLSAVDTDADAAYIPDAVSVVIGSDGSIDAELWENDNGTRGTVYTNHVVVYADSSYQREVKRICMGKIVVIGDAEIQDLLVTNVVPSTQEDALALAQAAAASAEDDADRAEAAADVALAGSPYRLPTFAALSRLTYGAATGNQIRVAAGDVVDVPGVGAYQVAASGATDQHVTTAGSVKLYVLPGGEGCNVKAFGAVGDGVTDDTTAIQAAIDTGSNVFIPEGTYNITDTLFIVTDGQTVRGLSKFNTIIRNTTNSNRLIQFGRSPDSVGRRGQFCTLRDLRLTGNAATIEGLATLGIVDDGVTGAARDVTLSNVYISEVGAGYGMRVSAWELYAESVTIFNCNRGLLLGSEANSCTFVNTYISSCTNEAVVMPNASGIPAVIEFIGLTAQYSGGTDATIDIRDGYSVSMRGLYLEGNTAPANVYFAGKAKNVTIDGCIHNLVTGTATRVVRANDVKVLNVKNLVNIGGNMESLVRIEGTLPLSFISGLFVAVGSVSVNELDDKSTRKATVWQDPLEGRQGATDLYALTTQSNLRTIDSATDSVLMDLRNGRIYFGAAGAVPNFRRSGSTIALFSDDGTTYGNFRPLSLTLGANNVRILTGNNTPEGSVTADVGSLFLRTNGGAGTTLYVKETGTGNTGWVAK